MGVLRKIAMKLIGQYYSSNEMLEKLRSAGAIIGQDVRVYAPNKVRIDATAPYLLKIGDHVRICENVTILTHDYSWSVLKCHTPEDGLAGAVLGAQSPVVIGSHVFIGMNATIMRGVTIGDNVIIGASSVVSKDCESGWVYAGNPAKKIMTIEEYYVKRRAKQLDEAKTLARCYYERYGKAPEQEVLSEYFMLFCNKEQAEQVPAFLTKMKLLGNYDDTVKYMENTVPMFSSYDEFIQEALFNS